MNKFKRNCFECPNCGTTFDQNCGVTFISSPAEDKSNTGIIRIVLGGLLFAAGCVQGLVYEGENLGLIGAGLLIWGWYVRKKTIDAANHILKHYPYWSGWKKKMKGMGFDIEIIPNSVLHSVLPEELKPIYWHGVSENVNQNITSHSS